MAPGWRAKPSPVPVHRRARVGSAVMPRSLVVLLFAACAADPGPAITATPDHGSMFGHYDVTLTGNFDSLGDISYVKLGGTRAYDVRTSADGSITVTVQGAPSPGAVDVVIDGTRGRATHRVFTYDPADVPRH